MATNNSSDYAPSLHSVQVGGSNGTLTNVSATANTGAVLQNNSGSDPSYSTATYPSTAGTTGYVMTSNGTNWVSSSPTSGTLTEVISTIAVGSAVALTTDVNKTITSITLSVGTWEITSFLIFAAASSTSTTQMLSSISTTTNSNAGNYGLQSSIWKNSTGTGTNHNNTLIVPNYRVIVSSGTTVYYAVATATFLTSTFSCYGTLKAIKVG